MDHYDALVNKLAALRGAQPQPDWEAMFGQDVRRILVSAGAEVAPLAVRRLVETSTFRPAVAEVHAAVVAITAERFQASGEHEGPKGCGDCAGVGAVRAAWVFRSAHGGPIDFRSRMVYCACARGDWMRDQHGASKNPMGPVKMQHVTDFCRGIGSEPLIELSDQRRGIIWWRIKHPADDTNMPAELDMALKALGGRKGTQAPREALVVEEAREERGPMAGRVLRPDRGWEALAEVNL